MQRFCLIMQIKVGIYKCVPPRSFSLFSFFLHFICSTWKLFGSKNSKCSITRRVFGIDFRDKVSANHCTSLVRTLRHYIDESRWILQLGSTRRNVLHQSAFVNPGRSRHWVVQKVKPGLGLDSALSHELENRFVSCRLREFF